MRRHVIKRKLVLHIGGEKTGSTSIQKAMSSASFYLLKNKGIFYPVNKPLCDWIAHNPVCGAFARREAMAFLKSGDVITPDVVIDQLRWCSKYWQYSVIVLSSEHLSSQLSGPEIRTLKSSLKLALPNHEFLITYFARSQVGLFLSNISNTIFNLHDKWNLARDINDTNINYNHTLILSEWVRNFGVENIRVLNYHSGDAVDTFCDLIGAPHLATSRERVALSYEECRLLQLVARAIGLSGEAIKLSEGDHSISRAEALREEFLATFKELHLTKTPIGQCISPDEILYIQSQFRDANNLLQEKFRLDFNLNDFQHVLGGSEPSQVVAQS